MENRMVAWEGVGSGNVGGLYVGVNDPVEKEKWTVQGLRSMKMVGPKSLRENEIQTTTDGLT